MIASVREGTDTAVSAMREDDQRTRQMLDEAEGAEQTRGAGRELSRLANDLKGMIGRFVV